ncbi:arginine N-succinyltransferase [Paraglaciecola aquimarina]|uniref:Arginine N-succinyltransferase n=1 Tax=Paraglaciecola aquimarina TaxID=1235557 RepID=A0ABU3SS16_9ALTE|nr:arginine N-succinyltransferase [Paraglaciecola aquimarina]MDU0352802.1 arginine N-succinyltransferase [Paraglaciecola aquimarina]
MNIIRPIRESDNASLFSIAQASGVGFTSLPVNEALLTNKINKSIQSFNSHVTQPGDESYLFVMEDSHTKHIVGTSGIASSVGLDDAFYHYHLSKVVHASSELNIYNMVDILTLCNDYTGVSEICTLFLLPEARNGLNGRLLSKFRFLFMMEHQHRFSETIIAEMRGINNEHGQSPFWQWLEEHFFSMDFPTVDYLTGIGQKQFIAELMPKYPIYVSLLSKEAQAVIGQVHEKTKPALQMLEQEGFSCRGYVDIFDAGPTVEANLKHIRSAQASRRLPVKIHTSIDQAADSYFVINTAVENFRGITTKLQVHASADYVNIDQESATALNISDGDSIRFAPTHFRT